MNMRIIVTIALMALIGHGGQAQAAVKDFKNFKSIPVLEGGRLKPLDTFARSILTQFSGKDHYEKQSGASWLATLFFNPEATLNDKIFQINNPDTATAIGITPEQHRRYTPAQLQKVYRKLAQLYDAAEKIPEKERSLVENEIIRVFGNINMYADLSRAFLFTDPNQRVNLNFRSSPFLAIPIEQHKEWLTPMDALEFKSNDDRIGQLLSLWKNMATSYRQGNDGEFNVSAHLYLNLVHDLMSQDELKNFNKFSLELLYHAASPFTLSIMFYIITFIFFVVSFSSTNKIWYQLATGSTLTGFVIHSIGLVMRIIIMNRPPVSNLYETFVFVGFIAVFLGLAIELYNRQWLGLVTAAISGTALLFIANRYSADGDTLQMLVAVLNSNFWLATHVTTITMGYGATCVAGVLGHIWLLQATFGKDKQTLDKTCKTTLGILGVALTLTFLGTNLGGIWADQSWGRFWGWDPKENGALMIVIWVAMLLHARVAKIVGPLGVAVGSVVGMLVVMWAWFGVNLLSVGLHSYGFTSGIATSLIVYVICEIIFLTITTWKITTQLRSSQISPKSR